MNIESLREYCLSLPGVAEDVKWDVNLCFSIFDKIFLFVGVDGTPTRMSAKVLEEEFEEYLIRDNFAQPAYLKRGQWVQVNNIELEENVELKKIILQSYDLIKAKLTKKKQAELEKLKDQSL